MVWQHVSTMAGVNAELWPLMRMTVPEQHKGFDISHAPTKIVCFHSWLLLGGVIPIDRHSLTLDQVYEAKGFDERSYSFLQKEWVHQRRVEPLGDERCIVEDLVNPTPRIGAIAPLVVIIARSLFEHRHHRLRERYNSKKGR